MKRIYLDYAATRPLRPAAAAAMEEAERTAWGNASAVYSAGLEAKRVLETARETLAASIGAKRGEIYFTSGGTEADNWALISAAEEAECVLRKRMPGVAPHIVTTAVEHHAVLRSCEYLERRGFELTVLPVDRSGLVSPEAVRAALRPNTCLVSVMAVNNEIGTIEPAEEIGAVLAAYNEAERGLGGKRGERGPERLPVLFHVDAVQAYGRRRLPACDLLSVSAHKLGGPKGIGFLYIRDGLRAGAFLHGGMQERGRRAGTENVPAAAGFAAAVRETMASAGEAAARERALRELLWEEIRRGVPEAVLNGAPLEGDLRTENNLNLSIPGVEAETLLILLDMEGICASGGSACTTGATEPSHVLTAIGAGARRAKGALRFTLGEETTKGEIRAAASAVCRTARRLLDRRAGGDGIMY
ncbi:cysteine desulfurase family protein [Lachnoclostridium sp. Marseille-P6806]|uniref:cysteine desulfurase family protein n=1 Tax=Lachnoclostridium sp. Marseille-P6806 TaxID=2364793 RepID=UPI0010310739|nr:cysteine desulfurase family protein [Lachnoclostridium sp. Marseille-P6806]